MENTQVKELLEQLKNSNKKADEINRENESKRGFIKAKIEDIRKGIQELNELGYNIEFKLVDDVTIAPETLSSFKQVYAQVFKQTQEQAENLENLLSAVESKDYAKIKELTGQDVSEIDYQTELSDIESLKETVAQQTETVMSAGVSAIESVEKETLDTGLTNKDEDSSKDDLDFTLSNDQTEETVDESTDDTLGDLLEDADELEVEVQNNDQHDDFDDIDLSGFFS